jgi:glycosyltransferase involved in cell wall biosynthesis
LARLGMEKEALCIAYLAIIDIAAESAETRHVFEMCENWKRLGHMVTLFVPDARGEPSEEVSIRMVKMETFRLKTGFLLTLVFNVMVVFHLLKQFSKKRIDVVYTRQAMFEFIPLFFLKRLGVRYIAEVNGIDSEQKRLYRMAEWKIRLTECLHGICYGLTDSIVTVTDEIREYLSDRYPGTREKTYVVPNGANVEVSIPIPKEDACLELDLNPLYTYVVFVGSLKKWHGVENAILLVEKLNRHNRDRSIRLIVVGEGPEEENLRNMVSRKGLDREVMFEGKVTHSRVFYYIGAATVCLALFDRERNDRTGLSPLKIFEYMACGRPVVATDVGNVRSIIERHKCGLIVEPGNIDSMSQAVMKLVRNPELAKELGENGREAAVRHYSWRTIGKNVLDIMQAPGRTKE